MRLCALCQVYAGHHAGLAPVQVDEAVSETGRRSGPPMTVDGAVQKTSLLLAVAAAAGAATWMQVRAQRSAH